MKMNESDLRLALRYAGVKDPDHSPFQAALMEMEPILEESMAPKTTWRVFQIVKQADEIRLEPGGLVLPGQMARMMLVDCDQVILAAGTLGHGFDRQSLLFQAQNDPAKALLFDAAGSALIERVLDELEETLHALPEFQDLYFTDRFSCGYGDLPISLQKEIGQLLNLPFRCGISVLDSYMMAPTKSITALIGVSKHPQPAKIRGCGFCSLQEHCAYRKKGTTCHGK